MLDKDRWEQIAGSLSGNLSENGEDNLQSWVSSSEENRKLYNEAKLIWNNSAKKLTLEDVSTEKQWEELLSSLDEDQPVKLTIFRNNNVWLKIAASIALFAVFIYAFQTFYNPSTTRVAKGEVMTLYLPDSTRVWLNINSTLSYADNFNEDSRNVELEGEAFFAVRRDTSRQFIVTTESASTSVLGTSFNVQESDSVTTILTVAEGKVKFAARGSEYKSENVQAKEKAVYDYGSNKLIKSQNDNFYFASWREKNNPVYELEKNKPKTFLKNSNTWKKNQINQSVIDGKLTNTASLAVYSQIILKVRYTKPNGKNTVTHVTVFDSVQPGRTIDYTKRLLDIFTDTRSLQVEVESAKVIAGSIY